jgi:hypothetical protein
MEEQMRIQTRLLVPVVAILMAVVLLGCEDEKGMREVVVMIASSPDDIPDDPPDDTLYQLTVMSLANVPDDPPDHVRYRIEVESRYALPEYWPSHVTYYLRDEMGEMERVPRPEPPPSQTGCSAGF